MAEGNPLMKVPEKKGQMICDVKHCGEEWTYICKACGQFHLVYWVPEPVLSFGNVYRTNTRTIYTKIGDSVYLAEVDDCSGLHDANGHHNDYQWLIEILGYKPLYPFSAARSQPQPTGENHGSSGSPLGP
jgi:hypothetical protein